MNLTMYASEIPEMADSGSNIGNVVIGFHKI